MDSPESSLANAHTNQQKELIVPKQQPPITQVTGNNNSTSSPTNGNPMGRIDQCSSAMRMSYKLQSMMSSYHQNRDKIQLYEQQIEALIQCNRKLMEVLSDFELQEEKLIKRLKRMEQINLEYMRQYCQVKGREFKIPNLPQHKSIFARVNLTELSHTSVIGTKSKPIINHNNNLEPEADYKQKLKSTLKQYCRIEQKPILETIQSYIIKQLAGSQKYAKLVSLKQIIKQHNQQSSSITDQMMILDKLASRLMIRNKIQQIFDSALSIKQVISSPKQQTFQQQINQHNDKYQEKHSQYKEEQIAKFIEENSIIKQTNHSLKLNIEQLQAQYEQLEKTNITLRKQKEDLYSRMHQISPKQKSQMTERRRSSNKSTSQVVSINLSQEAYLLDASNSQLLKISIARLQKNNAQLQKQISNYEESIQKSRQHIEELEESLMDRLEKNMQLDEQNKQKQGLIKMLRNKKSIPNQSHPIVQQKRCQIVQQKTRSVKTLQICNSVSVFSENNKYIYPTAQMIQERNLQMELQLETLQISAIKARKCVKQLQQQRQSLIEQHGQRMLTIKQQQQDKDRIIKTISESHEQINLKNSERIEHLEQESKIAQQIIRQLEDDKVKLSSSIRKMEGERMMIQNLGLAVYQVLGLISAIEVKDWVQKKLRDITVRLKEFLTEYQINMNWDIEKQAPAHLGNQSVDINLNRTGKEQLSNLEQLQEGYSFDLKYLSQADRQSQFKKQKPRHNKSVLVQLKSRDLSLNLSNEHVVVQKPQQNMEDQSDKDEFETLRRLYQQAVECLEMEEKKTKKMELDYQRYVDIIYTKQKLDPQEFSLEKQLAHLTRLTQEQKQTIQTERKQYNQIFREYHQQSQAKINEQISELRSMSFEIKPNKQFF